MSWIKLGSAKSRAYLARRALARRAIEACANYEASVERWISLSDRVCDAGGRVGVAVARAATESPLVAPESKALVRLTLSLLLAVFTWILVSCQSLQGAQNADSRRRSPAPPSARVEKRAETLYLKRDTLRIKPKDSGSTTGSLWADTEAPRQLVADERPMRQGEMVSIAIPDALQFVSPESLPAGAVASAAKGNKGDKVAKGADTKGAKPAAPGSEASTAAAEAAGGDPNAPKFTDPNATGVLGTLAPGPVKNFKMQIVGMEPGGEVYLRGVKTYANSLGEKRNVTLYAKIPTRQLTSFEADARDLTELALTEEVNGQTAEYTSTGWDSVVSRKLAGYSPDINAELQALEDVRRELSTEQDAIRERSKAMAEERMRMQKDRKRNADENERLRQALVAQKKGDEKKDDTKAIAGSPATAPQGNMPAGAPQANPNARGAQGPGTTQAQDAPGGAR